MDVRRLYFLMGLMIAWLPVGQLSTAGAAEFRSFWPAEMTRPWAGPEFWTNPLQDWRVQNGRLECFRSGGDRSAYLLTHDLNSGEGSFEMQVTLSRLDPDVATNGRGWVGFKVGSQGEFREYRDSAVRGYGLNLGLRTDGRLFIGRYENSSGKIGVPLDNITLSVNTELTSGGYTITLAAHDQNGSALVEMTMSKVDASWLVGSLALVCSAREPMPVRLRDMRPPVQGAPNTGDPARAGARPNGDVRFAFTDWWVRGSKVAAYPERAWGPILWTQYTLSRQVLKLTAQMAPVGNGSRIARLQILRSGHPGWQTISEATIDPLARTATFRVSDWDDTQDVSFRVAYTQAGRHHRADVQYHSGKIRKDPREKPDIVVAAITGNNDFGFPHADIVRNLTYHQPDLLAYTGDQIYERVGEYGAQRTDDVAIATLDYLRKWYMFGWEYGELLREIPSVCLPDDHDVFQGNIWGAGGRTSSLEEWARAGIDAGGYVMPPVWVNMIQRTQTSHMPDPDDPTPVWQGISVYYGSLNVGGVSFAILEDRKWKSSPTVVLPDARIINGWSKVPAYDAATDGDVAGAVLLGQRQLDYLDTWAADWSAGTWMKVVISQTIFANVATLPRADADSDEITPRLRVLPPGGYAEDDVRVQDHDSNGWPQTGRNKALERMRRAFAFHIAGDQHLGSTVQYGIDDWRDAGFAICVPSVANIWPRRWFPSPADGHNRKSGAPPYTGDFLDGFGNKVTVLAVSNPHTVTVEPQWINLRAPGYGIISFHRESRKITMANWPRWVDASQPDAKPYPGWPVTIDQMDNYGREAVAYLPTVKVQGVTDPVVQVIDESNNEIVYTIRITGNAFQPKVFREGSYTIRVGEPNTPRMRTFEHVQTAPVSDHATLTVEL